MLDNSSMHRIYSHIQAMPYSLLECLPHMSDQNKVLYNIAIDVDWASVKIDINAIGEKIINVPNLT